MQGIITVTNGIGDYIFYCPVWVVRYKRFRKEIKKFLADIAFQALHTLYQQTHESA